MSDPIAANQNDAVEVLIFVDLDGVLANFMKHVIDHGKLLPDGTFDYATMDEDWWASIPEFEGARKFYDALCDVGRTRFLTGPSQDPGSFSGKARFVMALVPERGREILKDLLIVHAENKSLAAGPGRILVDDLQKNINAWEAAGGIGVLHEGDYAETLRKVLHAEERFVAEAQRTTAPAALFSTPRGMVGTEFVDPGLVEALQKSWSRESAYPPCQQDWTPENPSYGQCWVTAALVWDHLEGDSKIITGEVFEPSDDGAQALWHFQQELDGQRIDLTWQQFEEKSFMGETPRDTKTWKSRIAASIDGDPSFVPRLNVLLGNLKKAGFDMFTTAEDVVARFKAAHDEVFPAARQTRANDASAPAKPQGRPRTGGPG